MLPISIAGSIVIGWPFDQVAGLDRAHVDGLEREVATGLHAGEVVVGLVRARDPAALGVHGAVEQHGHLRPGAGR